MIPHSGNENNDGDMNIWVDGWWNIVWGNENLVIYCCRALSFHFNHTKEEELHDANGEKGKMSNKLLTKKNERKKDFNFWYADNGCKGSSMVKQNIKFLFLFFF